MPKVERIDHQNDVLYKNVSKRTISNKCIHSTALSLIDKATIEFKYDTTGSIENKSILDNIIKYISIWPTIIIVETNTHITRESLSTSSLSKLIDDRLYTLDIYNIRDNDMPIINTTKSRLNYIKSILPIIIILEPSEWEITREGRIYFQLKGSDGLQDLVSIFDIKVDEWVSKSLYVINLDTEAVFYPYLDILDIVLDHASLSSNDPISIKLKNQVIFRLTGIKLSISSPLYSAKTTHNFEQKSGEADTKISNIKRAYIDFNNIIYLIENGLYNNHNSIARIKDILFHQRKPNIRKNIPLILTKGYIPGFSNLDKYDAEEEEEEGVEEEDDIISGAADYKNDGIFNRNIDEECKYVALMSDDDGRITQNHKFKKVNFFIAHAIVYNSINDSNTKNSNNSSEEGKNHQNYNSFIDSSISNIVNITESQINKHIKHQTQKSNGKVKTFVVFNSLRGASRLIKQPHDNVYNNIKVDIEIDGNLISPSLVTGIDETNGKPLLKGGMVVADTAGCISLRPIFECSFPKYFYNSISIQELVTYLLDPVQSIREEKEITHECYRPMVELLYNILFKDIVHKKPLIYNDYDNDTKYKNNDKNDVEKILLKMNKLVLELSKRLFSVSNEYTFTDRLWDLPHWNFPIGVILYLYGILIEHMNIQHALWQVTHQSVLEKLLIPVFDALLENGVWVASQVRDFMAWVVDGTLLPLLYNKTLLATCINSNDYNSIIDTIINLAFQWISINSAAQNNGLCKCFPNSCTWFYIEPKRKMTDFVYSLIPKFILCDKMNIHEVPIASQAVHSLIKNWPPSKRIKDKLFALRNLTTDIKQSLSYSFVLNTLNGLKVIIKKSLHTNTGEKEGENNNINIDNNIPPKYHYNLPSALLKPNTYMLSLGKMRDQKMFESSLSVVWTNKKPPVKSQTNEIIMKLIADYSLPNNNKNNNEDYFIKSTVSDLSRDYLNHIKKKKQEIHSRINHIVKYLSLDVIDEITSIINGSITVYDTDNDGFAWLFNHGLAFNLVKSDSVAAETKAAASSLTAAASSSSTSSSSSSLLSNEHHIHKIHISTDSTGLNQLDKLLSLIDNINAYENKMGKNIVDIDINAISSNNACNNLENTNDRILDYRHRTIAPFQFLEHIEHYRSQMNINKIKKDSKASCAVINIDSTLVFLYKKLPEVLESIILRVLITYQPEEIELVRKLAINISRIIADSLLVILDPRNAINIKTTLKEPTIVARDSMGVISIYRKGQRGLDEGEDVMKSRITEILSSSRIFSLLNDKDTLQAYIDSLHSYRPLSLLFTAEERNIIEEENSPILKNIKGRRGLEDIGQLWNNDNINRPYVVPTYEENNNRIALLTNMPDNISIYVPVLPTSFLLDDQIDYIINIVENRTKHLAKERNEQSNNIKKCREEISAKITKLWSSDKSKLVPYAMDIDELVIAQNKQNIAIKNQKLLSNIPYYLDIDRFHLHLGIRSISDIDYYVKVPNFWKIMNMEEVLKFAIDLMLITLNDLISVGLTTAKRLSVIADVAKCLYEANHNTFF